MNLLKAFVLTVTSALWMGAVTFIVALVVGGGAIIALSGAAYVLMMVFTYLVSPTQADLVGSDSARAVYQLIGTPLFVVAGACAVVGLVIGLLSPSGSKVPGRTSKSELATKLASTTTAEFETLVPPAKAEDSPRVVPPLGRVLAATPALAKAVPAPSTGPDVAVVVGADLVLANSFYATLQDADLGLTTVVTQIDWEGPSDMVPMAVIVPPQRWDAMRVRENQVVAAIAILRGSTTADPVVRDALTALGAETGASSPSAASLA